MVRRSPLPGRSTRALPLRSSPGPGCSSGRARKDVGGGAISLARRLPRDRRDAAVRHQLDPPLIEGGMLGAQGQQLAQPLRARPAFASLSWDEASDTGHLVPLRAT